MSENVPPIPPDLRRELEQVRAASSPSQASPEPSVQSILAKWIVRLVVGWFLLVLVFLGIWQLVNSP